MSVRGFAVVALDGPKTEANLGGALRAAHCFRANMIVVSRERFRKESTDTTKAWRHIPVVRNENPLDALPYDCVPVAVDMWQDATPLQEYKHPERAMYIFGPEDGFVRKEIKERCRDAIFIPTAYCLNLAATVNVVLYDRLAKNLIQKGEKAAIAEEMVAA